MVTGHFALRGGRGGGLRAARKGGWGSRRRPIANPVHLYRMRHEFNPLVADIRQWRGTDNPAAWLFRLTSEKEAGGGEMINDKAVQR